jgi:hypothetical protein
VSELPPIEPPPAPPSPPLPYQGLPWEAPNAGLGSLFPTAGQFITSPVRAYTKMSLTADLVRPIAYFVAFVLLGAVVSQFWSVLFWDQIMGFVKAFVPPQFQSFIQRPSLVTITFGVVIAPLISLIVLFIWSGILHLILALLGGAAGGFATRSSASRRLTARSVGKRPWPSSSRWRCAASASWGASSRSAPRFSRRSNR